MREGVCVIINAVSFRLILDTLFDFQILFFSFCLFDLSQIFFDFERVLSFFSGQDDPAILRFTV